jgi:glyoxylase-like metal-dependent hydrolase (beta-lactamase superfamily II)
LNAAGTLPAGVVVFERGWLSSNNILFVGHDETALVDSGYVTHSEQTLALVERALAGQPLDLLLNTHLHSDHCGGNAALQQRYPQMRTLIPPGDAPLVRRWDEDGLSFRSTGQQCARFEFEGLIEQGQELLLADSMWQVHGAAGHDPNSVVLFEPQSRTLISADALWESGFGVVFPELVGEASFDEVAKTLDLIEGLDPLCVIPGHGRAFYEAEKALGLARRRLEGLVIDPSKHARHALKVLMKFKLLELQTVSKKDWNQWLRETPYFEIIRTRFFTSSELNALTSEILSELADSGVVSIEEDLVRNCDQPINIINA